MNILVVSEQFLSGGLETRMDVFYNYLKSKHNIVFAFGKYDGGRYLLDADNVYTGFHFNFHSTISEFLEDVDGLMKLIHENTIDAVIVQPFYSLFPAAFAANQADVPVLYMVHGRTSLNFNNIRNADILFLVSLEFLVTAVGTVSKKYNSWVESVKRDKNVIYLPNAIDSRLLTEHKIAEKNVWASVSRIDTDNYSTIMKIIDAVDTFRLDRLDIFGKGDSEREVEEYIACKGLQDRVFLKGYTNDLNFSLKGYKGIFAQGRSAIESLAMGYPVVLAGYGKIIGVIDHSNLPSLLSNNFVAGDCSECSGLELENQFKAINDKPGQYNLREEIINKLDVKYVADNYIETLENLDSTRVMQGVEFLSDLRSLADTDDWFYLSKFVYSLLKKYFKPYSYNVYLSSMFTLHDECIALQEVTTMLENNMNKLIQEIEVEKTRSIVTLIKRDLHKITSKFSLK